PPASRGGRRRDRLLSRLRAVLGLLQLRLRRLLKLHSLRRDRLKLLHPPISVLRALFPLARLSNPVDILRLASIRLLCRCLNRGIFVLSHSVTSAHAGI